MNGTLRSAWEYLPAELWDPLSAYSGKDAAATPDLFSDLFAAVDKFLSPRPTDTELAESRNDPDIARERFFALKGTDFSSESAIVYFLEAAFDVIADYEVDGFVENYQLLLRNVLRKFNLRYRLDDPFTLRILLPGSFTNLYSELHRLNTSNRDLLDLWIDFEVAFDQYARIQNDTELKTSIAKASNYLEGLASLTNGKTGTLGKLCDSLSEWPHDKVKEAVKNLYGFCSDYPGIRHAGTPGNRKRQLDRRDSVAINVCLMALAAYLSKNLDQGEMLGIGLSFAGRPRPSSPEEHLNSNDPGMIRKLLSNFGLRF